MQIRPEEGKQKTASTYSYKSSAMKSYILKFQISISTIPPHSLPSLQAYLFQSEHVDIFKNTLLWK